MQIIAPTYITDDTLISSDISEATEVYPEWSPTYPYVTGQRVVVTDEGIHKIYEAMWGNDNINYYPPDNLDGNPTIWWMKISATNLWKLFDMIVAPDRTEVDKNIFPVIWDSGISWQSGVSWTTAEYTSFQVTVQPGEIDSVAILNADCTSFAVIIMNGETEVFNEVVTPSITDNFNSVIENLPSYPNATIEVLFRDSNGDTIYVGEIIYGVAKTLGITRYGVNVGIVDYSLKERNWDGTFSIVERAFSRRSDFNFFVPTSAHTGTLRILENYRSIPLVWIISDLYSTTIVYGYYRDLRMTVRSNALTEGSVSIEGLGADWVHVTPPDIPWVDPWDGHIQLPILSLPDSSVSTNYLAETPVSVPTNSINALALATPIINREKITLYLPAPTDLGVCTISNAEPTVITSVAHGLPNDHRVLFHTTGALPSPLVVDRIYYVENRTDDTFNITLTIGGSTIDTTNDGSGVHKLLYNNDFYIKNIDSSHSLTSDNLTLLVNHANLVISNSSHSLSSTNCDVAELIVSSSVHSLTSDNIVIEVEHADLINLTSSHSLTSDNIVIEVNHADLIISSCSHVSESKVVDFTSLSIHEAYHSLESDNCNVVED